MRHETYDGAGQLLERREVVRIDASTVRLRRWDGAGAVLEDRAADAAESAELAARESSEGLAASLVADLQGLGVDVQSVGDVRGKLDQVLPAARGKRAAKPTTDERLSELERQCEMLLKLVAALMRGLV